jgi:hypothetical protein
MSEAELLGTKYFSAVVVQQPPTLTIANHAVISKILPSTIASELSSTGISHTLVYRIALAGIPPLIPCNLLAS